VAAYQSGWNGQGALDSIPRVAALSPTEPLPDDGDAIDDLSDDVDPVLRRLGWHVARA
jgi:hypothetical protein